MSDPAFVEARKDGEWRVASRTLTGTCAGVAFEGERRWWGGRWALTSSAPFPVPEKVLLYISAKGMEHGYWRDLLVGDRAFDAANFVFCDTPALLPLLVGPATRRALSDYQRMGDALILHVRGGVTRVIGSADENDKRAVTRHLHVHQALEDDHEACLARWKELVTATHGRAEAEWPPVGTIMSRTGTLHVYTTWTAPTTRDGADWERSADSLRTHLKGGDGRTRKKWSLVEMPPGIAGTHQFRRKHVTIWGESSISIPLLDDLVNAGDVVGIWVGGPQLAVAMRGLPDARQFDAGLRIIELIVDPAGSGSPYR